MILTLITTVLCWISVSVSQFYTVEVQPGEEVTLQCSNFSIIPSHIFWFKLANGPNASLISSMFTADSKPTFFDGFQDDKYNMKSNTSVLFLEIKRVDFSDSGLYFCGENKDGNPIFVSGTCLKVQVKDGLPNLMSAILGSLTFVLLLIIIGLVAKIRTFHKGQDEKQNPQNIENVDSDAMNYAALNFHPKPKGTRTASQRELEPNVVYAATR